MPRHVLLECEHSAEAPVLLDAGPLVEAIALLVGHGFIPESADAGYIQPAIDGPEDVRSPALLYLPGTIDEIPVGATVVAAGWTIRVFHDPEIKSPTYATGVISAYTEADVARELHLTSFALKGAQGQEVAIGIVDAGINLAHLTKILGAAPQMDTGLPLIHPTHPHAAGASGIGHGTMCAYDALLAAPRSCLLDVACLEPLVLGSNETLRRLLSRVHRVFLMLESSLPVLTHRFAGIVLCNSWAISDTSADLPIGDPANYSANRSHPFNRIVTRLDYRGVDLVFAAGNCGAGGPYGNCIPDNLPGAIYGANSHAGVLTVAAVDLARTPLSSSSMGPGRLFARKPDIAAFANFKGSRLTSNYYVDGQTSAACAVGAGVIGAIRSVRPSTYVGGPSSLTPSEVRQQIRTTAGGNYNARTGFGIINGQAIAYWL